jgi:hypothetical protein
MPRSVAHQTRSNAFGKVKYIVARSSVSVEGFMRSSVVQAALRACGLDASSAAARTCRVTQAESAKCWRVPASTDLARRSSTPINFHLAPVEDGITLIVNGLEDSQMGLKTMITRSRQSRKEASGDIAQPLRGTSRAQIVAAIIASEFLQPWQVSGRMYPVADVRLSALTQPSGNRKTPALVSRERVPGRLPRSLHPVAPDRGG